MSIAPRKPPSQTLATLQRALPNIVSTEQRDYDEYEEYDEDTPEDEREDFRYAALGE